jgi:hypothetical protein
MTKTRLTKKQALSTFKEELNAGPFPDIRNDKVAMAEAWNIYTDSLCKDNRITLKQYESWTNPF